MAEAAGPGMGGPAPKPARRPGKQAGRRRGREQDPDVRLSKALSYALRHGADKLGLQMGPDFPETVAHGTYLRYWPAIRSKGLSRMGRTHIHLAPGLPGDGAVLSGMRHNCEVAITIDVAKALADGICFYRSANSVILTPGDANGLLAPCYFREALQLRPVRCQLSLE